MVKVGPSVLPWGRTARLCLTSLWLSAPRRGGGEIVSESHFNVKYNMWENPGDQEKGTLALWELEAEAGALWELETEPVSVPCTV